MRVTDQIERDGRTLSGEKYNPYRLASMPLVAGLAYADDSWSSWAALSGVRRIPSPTTSWASKPRQLTSRATVDFMQTKGRRRGLVKAAAVAHVTMMGC